MSLLRQLMRFAGAAIVFAVLALAPSESAAHQGHSHSGATIHESLADVAALGEAPQALQESTSQFADAASLPHEQPAQNGCTDTCCKSAVACCVLIFTQPGETPLKPGTATRLPFPETASWTSLAPDRLARPPKSIA